MFGNETTRPARGDSISEPMREDERTKPLRGHEALALAHEEQDTLRERPNAGPSRALALPVPGTRIGQYELIRLLGRGGMGEVYQARDLRLGRLVAIKLLTTHRPDLDERFLDEARATARCHHENIVVIYEVGEAGGHPYMVLEYLEARPCGSGSAST